MKVLETIRNRGSIRRYRRQPIRGEDLDKILEAARLSQSAGNRQPWEFVVVDDSEMKNRLVDVAGNQEFVAEAGAVIVCLADPSTSAKVGPFEGYLIDVAIAIENMVLTAWDLDIGSCWIGAYSEPGLKRLLGIPDKLRVASLLTLGYPAEKPAVKRRKRLEEIVHRNRYSNRSLD